MVQTFSLGYEEIWKRLVLDESPDLGIKHYWSSIIIHNSYHITKPIISMIISFNDSKNFFTGIPRSLTRPSTMPKTMENTTNPRTFILRAAISRPAGTVSDPGAISSRMVVKFCVPLLKIFIELFGGNARTSIVLLYSLYSGETTLYLVLFC